MDESSVGFNRWNTITSKMGIGQILEIPKPVLGGLLHLMWHIETSQGKFAVKELNKSIVTSEKIVSSYELTEKIAGSFQQKGISAVISCKIKGQSVIKIENSYFIVYHWVEAESVHNSYIKKVHIDKISTILAKMHGLKIEIRELGLPDWGIHKNEYIESQLKIVAEQDHAFKHKLMEFSDRIFEWNARYKKSIPSLKANLVISHGDLDPKNVLWDQYENPYLIDWESARYLNPAQEALNSALDWSDINGQNVNMDLFSSFLEKYRSESGVDVLDSRTLQDSLNGIRGNWINWLVYNVERSINLKNTPEERKMGAEQIIQVMGILQYLEKIF